VASFRLFPCVLTRIPYLATIAPAFTPLDAEEGMTKLAGQRPRNRVGIPASAFGRAFLMHCLPGVSALSAAWLCLVGLALVLPAACAWADDAVEVETGERQPEIAVWPVEEPAVEVTTAFAELVPVEEPDLSLALEPLVLKAQQYEVPTEIGELIDYLAVGYEQPHTELTLEEAVALALKHNHDLNSKRLSAAAACAGVEVNWAALRPQLGIQAKAYIQDTNANTDPIEIPVPDADPIVIDVSGGGEHDIRRSLAISLTQRIYDFGLTNDLIDVAEAQHAIEYHTVEMTEQQLVHDVVSAYYQFNLALGYARIHHDELRLAEEFLRQTQIQFEVGVVPRLDVIRAEARVEQARESFIAAVATTGDTAARFYSLLGAEDQRYTPAVVTAALVEQGAPPPALPVAVDQGLCFRPEIELQYAVLFAGEKKLDLTANRPIIEAYANAMYLKPASGFTGTDSYECGVQLVWNLYTGGKDSAERRQAELELSALSEGILDLEAKIELDVTVAWNRLYAAREAVQAARKNLELSGEGLRAAAVGYSAGVTPYLEFMDAMDSNVAAALAYLFTLAEVKLSQINLVRAQGFPEGYPGDPRVATPVAETILEVISGVDGHGE